MGKFTDDIRAFTRKFQDRAVVTTQIAVQDTVSMAQRTRGEGGRMRVKYGFLRASIQGSLNGMPTGPASNPEKKTFRRQAKGEIVAAAILKWNPSYGRPIYIGWTANYARHREAQDGFLRGAVEVWDQTVQKAAAKVRAEL